MRVPGDQRHTREDAPYASASANDIGVGSLRAYSRRCISSKPEVCSSKCTRRTGSLASHGLTNATSGTHCLTVSVSLSLPASCNWSAVRATNDLETEPTRNSVSAVTGRLAATSALDRPVNHSALSWETMTMAAPGVLDSF